MRLKNFLRKVRDVWHRTLMRAVDENTEKIIAELRQCLERTNQNFSLVCGELAWHRGELMWQHDVLKAVLSNSNSVFSYCNNKALADQQKNPLFARLYKESGYAYYERLHALLQVHALGSGETYERMGGRNAVPGDTDGGYIIVHPYSRTKIAYSFGISDDVTWDKAMAERGYDIFMYDHTINALPEENKAFHWKKIGITGKTETDELKRLDTLLRENGHDNTTGMVLKMDVEGCEWDVLQHIHPDVLAQFDQILLELHDLLTLQDAGRHIAALENLTQHHAVVHVHGNNYRGVQFVGDLITPQTLEITLVKKDLHSLSPAEERKSDSLNLPNFPLAYDIVLGKW